MTASELLTKIESLGGVLTLLTGDKLSYNDVPEELLAELHHQKYLVMALLKERRACEAYERSGRDSGWHRDYPFSTTPWPRAYTCPSIPLPHLHDSTEERTEWPKL